MPQVRSYELKVDERESYEEIGCRLRLLRLAVMDVDHQRGWCERHGFKPPSWNAYEKGKTLISTTDLMRLKRLYGVTIDWITSDDRRMMPGYLLDRIDEIEEIEARGEKAAPRIRRD